MKKITLLLLALIIISFGFEYKWVCIGKGGTKDTLLADIADTVNMGTAFDGASRVNLFYWADTIGDAVVSVSCVGQVSPDNSHWNNYIPAVFGDSLVTEVTAVVDTSKLNNAVGGCYLGTFKYTRFIFTGVDAAQKAILNVWAMVWR